MASSRAQIEVREPHFFGFIAIHVLAFFAALLTIPILVAIAIAVFLMVRIDPLPIFAIILIIHLALATTLYFLPFGFGNPYVTHLVKLFERPTLAKRRQFVVQVTLCPRLRSGYRAFVEDADDIGVLRFDDTDLVFEGDATTIRLPLNQISYVRLKNIGWRGLWLASQRVAISIFDFPGVNSLEIVERSSWTIRKSRHITQEFYRLLEFHLQRHGSR